MARFITGLAVGLLVLAFIMPIALNQFFGVSTASFDANTVTIWAIIPVIALLVVVLYLLNRATDQT